MNEATRQQLVDYARTRSMEHPANVERAVSAGAQRYRLRVWRLYAAGIMTMVAAIATLLVVHPATGVLPREAAVESITLEPSAATLIVGESMTLAATVHRADGREQGGDDLEWSSSDSAVATVADGRVTGAAVGTATVTAEHPDAVGAATITVVEQPPAALASIAIDPPVVQLSPGDETDLTATGRYADGSALDLTNSATWVSDSAGVASVDANGHVIASAPGTVRISAGQDGMTGSATITVAVETRRLAGIRIESAPAALSVGEEVELRAVGVYSDGTSSALEEGVAWTSSGAGSAVATVDGSGRVTAIAPGTVRVIASKDGQAGSATITVVAAADPRIVGIRIESAPAVLRVEETAPLRAVVVYSDGSTSSLDEGVVWTSSDTKAVQISEGAATGISWGTSAEITAAWNGYRDSATVEVAPASLTRIDVNPPAPVINQAGEVQLTAVGVYEDGRVRTLEGIAWASANPGIASVDRSGLVVAQGGFGEVTITATVGELVGSATVTVEFVEG